MALPVANKGWPYHIWYPVFHIWISGSHLVVVMAWGGVDRDQEINRRDDKVNKVHHM
jgi:hypothetical protein